MTRKEIKKQLVLSEPNLRCYERAFLAKGKKRKTFTEDEVLRLQQVVVLRKLHVSFEDIHSLLWEEETLDDVLQKELRRIGEYERELQQEEAKTERKQRDKDEEMAACHTVKTYIQQLLICGVTMGDLGVVGRELSQKERMGVKFCEIKADYLVAECTEEDLLKKPWWKILTPTALTACACVVAAWIRGGVFKEDTLGELLPFVLAYAFLLPFLLLRKKYEKTAKIYLTVISAVSCAFLALVLLALIMLILNAKFHFLF